MLDILGDLLVVQVRKGRAGAGRGRAWVAWLGALLVALAAAWVLHHQALG